MANHDAALMKLTPEWLYSGAVGIFNNLAGLFGPYSRFYLPYLGIAIILAYVAYRVNRAQINARGKESFLSYVFDREKYIHPSSLVDLKIVLANRLFTPMLIVAGRAATVISAATVASFFVSPETADAHQIHNAPFLSLLGVTLAVTLASDFTTYWVHRLHHENPVFWPFHKLHHSAETLTPITFARKHPVYDLIRAASNAFVVGPVQGLMFALFGIADISTILGVNIIYAVFYWSGANLRHSHVWLSYGPFWSRIFISPAQHQIHHSSAPRHHDTNYGELFAFWDQLFGTIYVPDGYEELEFGVAEADGGKVKQPHPTLAASYITPFRECAAALSASPGKPLEDQERPSPTVS